MLQMINGRAIATDDYYIKHCADGIDELQFELSICDPAYAELYEEALILETTEQQIYTVKSIAGGKDRAKIGCELSLSEWCGMVDIYYDRTGTPGGFLKGFKPDGWTVIDETAKAETKRIEMKGPTPLEVALQMQEDFGCAVRFDTRNRTATILWPREMPLSNTYVVDTVNLRQNPEFKGRSDELYTRLYPIGKDGLTIAEVNGGVPYVQDTTYTNKIICKVWEDRRFEDPTELKNEAQRRVSEACIPERSWKLKVVDLHRIDPQRWPDMRLDLFTVLRLVDGYKGFVANVQVCEDKIYPHHPEKNEITVSTVMRTVQKTLRRVCDAIFNPNSSFMQQLDRR